MSLRLPFGLTSTSTNTANSGCLGMEVQKNGIWYRLIYVHASGTALKAKSACYLYSTATDHVVTAASGATTAINNFIGVAQGTVAVSTYAWVIVRGLAVVFNEDASSVSTQPTGSPVYGGSAAECVTWGGLFQAASSASVIAGMRQLGEIAVGSVSSTSVCRYFTVRLY